MNLKVFFLPVVINTTSSPTENLNNRPVKNWKKTTKTVRNLVKNDDTQMVVEALMIITLITVYVRVL